MSDLDQQLIADYLAGDEKSLEILFSRYTRSIYSFIYRYIGASKDAEDVSQEVFVKAWRNLKKFDQGKSFKTWIFSIAKNSAIDFLKKKKAIPFSAFSTRGVFPRRIHLGRRSVLGGENENFVDTSPLPPELFEKAEIAQILNTALEKLSPQYRMVLFLRYNDHFTFREIAESLGEPLHTIKSRHRRALTALRSFITDK